MNPAAIATVAEYLATDAMQEWIRLRRAGETRVEIPKQLSATGAAISAEHYKTDLQADLPLEWHHD